MLVFPDAFGPTMTVSRWKAILTSRSDLKFLNDACVIMLPGPCFD